MPQTAPPPGARTGASTASSTRRRGPRLLVRLRRSLREVGEIFAFLGAGLSAILQLFQGRLPKARSTQPRGEQAKEPSGPHRRVASFPVND